MKVCDNRGTSGISLHLLIIQSNYLVGTTCVLRVVDEFFVRPSLLIIKVEYITLLLNIRGRMCKKTPFFYALFIHYFA